MQGFNDKGWLVIITLIEVVVLLYPFSTLQINKYLIVSGTFAVIALSWIVAIAMAPRNSPTKREEILGKQIWCVLITAIVILVLHFVVVYIF